MSISTSVIDYDCNGTELQGYFAKPDNAGTALPAIIIVHEWWGHTDYVQSRAEQVANAGYAAFALDLYGKGKSAETPPDAEALMNSLLSDPQQIVDRFDAALKTVSEQEGVDVNNIAAMGYCFGGAVVLNMARMGKPLKAVCSYHGLLETESPMPAGTFSGEMAVFTGEADPMVGPEIVSNFKEEMTSAGVNLNLVSYPDTLHGFTNPAATARGEKFGFPLKYSETADKDSWDQTMNLFKKIF